MLRAALAFLVLAVVAFVLGANGVAGMSMDIARILLFVFLGIAIITFIASFLPGGRQGRLP